MSCEGHASGVLKTLACKSPRAPFPKQSMLQPPLLAPAAPLLPLGGAAPTRLRCLGVRSADAAPAPALRAGVVMDPSEQPGLTAALALESCIPVYLDMETVRPAARRHAARRAASRRKG